MSTFSIAAYFPFRRVRIAGQSVGGEADIAKMLERHREGILNHCDHPIHTSKLEGINNKGSPPKELVERT